MSHPIDVGSVLGGRYKVTATVLASHDQDLVLDGVDQVLNRPVSILVAGPHNADQVAQSAREVATGERPGSVQILDLGVSDSTTYLITNHTSAADLLDLVVASNPPYVEPFFTDTLGSEIFGQPRSHEPEIYDDEEEVDAGYIDYGNGHRSHASPYPAAVPGHGTAGQPAVERGSADRGSAGVEHGAGTPGTAPAAGANAATAPVRKAPVVPPLPSARPGASAMGANSSASEAGAAAGAAAAGVAGANQSRQGTGAPENTGVPENTAPQPVQRDNVEQALLQREGNRSGNSAGASGHPGVPGAGSRQDEPKVSLWSQDDYDYTPEDEYTEDEYANDGGNGHTDRRAGSFPAAARNGGAAAAGGHDYTADDEGRRTEPRSMRWLVGGLLAAVLVVGLIFAVTNLGSLFRTAPQSQTTPEAPATASAPETPAGTPSPNPSTTAAAGPPAVEGVTRIGAFDFASNYDNDLAKTFDGNGASYWSDMEFATDNWGGLAPEGVPLVVKLKEPSKISSITLNQLGASGGNISVFTNDQPSLDGAKQVGTNSFTSPDLTMPLAEPVTAEYVIVSIENLPRLAAPKTRYGFGLRLAEIKVQ
ncbi:MAG: ABC transporter substrate-binding protein [Actinomycetota bacterium]|nr:ABC transporter substrate-binding protein [Actinomycetota bacterium]